MAKYDVVSREYGTVDVLFDGTGPMEYGADYVEVEADSPKEAKVKAVREFRRTSRYGHPHLNYCETDENPFTGLKATLVEEEDDAA